MHKMSGKGGIIMYVEKITYYDCPDCGEIHESLKEAKDCCPREFEKTVKYMCGDCGEEFDTKKEAEDCCKDDHDDA